MTKWTGMLGGGAVGVAVVVAGYIGLTMSGVLGRDAPEEVPAALITPEAANDAVAPGGEAPAPEAEPGDAVEVVDTGPEVVDTVAEAEGPSSGEAGDAVEAPETVVAPDAVDQVDAVEPSVTGDKDDAVEVPDAVATVDGAGAGAKPEAEDPAPLTPPQFDLVRVEPDGTALVAGLGAPKSLIAIFLDGSQIADTVAGSDGKFASLMDIAPSTQPRMLSLAMRVGDREVFADSEIIVAPFGPAPELVADAGDRVSEAEPVVAEDAVSETVAGARTEPDGETDAAALETEPAREDAGVAERESPVAEADLRADARDEPLAEDTAEPALDVAAAGDAAREAEAADVTEDAVELPMAEAEVPASEPPVAETDAAAGAPDVAKADAPDGTVKAEADTVARASEGAEAAAPGDASKGEEPEPPTVVATGEAEEAGDVAEDRVAEAGAAQESDELAQADAPERAQDSVAEAEAVVPDAAPKDAEVEERVAEAGDGTEQVPEADTAEGASDIGKPEPVTEDVPEAGEAAAETAETEAAGTVEAETEEVAVVAEPDAGAEDVAEEDAPPTLLASDEEGVRVLPGPEVLDRVAIDTISYDDAGDVALAGRGTGTQGGGFVRVYLDNTPITTSRIREDGSWRVTLPQVDKGVYVLRVDEVDEEGEVKSRAETPFQREDRETLEAASDAAGGGPIKIVTVQPGNTLWQIARERYGQGILYVRVFDANRGQIRDPDLIYPGQVFDLPEDEAAN